MRVFSKVITLFGLMGFAQLLSAQADFSIVLAPAQQTVWQGHTVTYLVTVQALNGFTDSVALSIGGLPVAASGSFSPATVAGSGTATLTIAAGAGAPTGTVTLMVTGTSPSTNHSATALLSVAVPPSINYTYDAAGRLTSVTDQYGQSAIYSYDALGNILSIARKGISDLSIAAFSPPSGVTGATVTILGSGFVSPANQNTVLFGGINATVTSASATLLTVTVPAGAVTGPITVTNANGTVTSASSFTVSPAPTGPTITAISPTMANGGTPLTITGTGFASAASANAVSVSGTSAVTASATPTSLVATVPGICGSGHITVQTPFGQSASAADFYFVPQLYTPANIALATRTQTGTAVNASFTAPGQGALLLFDGTQGQKTRLLVNSTANDQAVTVYGPDGSTVVPSTAINSNGNFIDTPAVAQTGTYTAVIQGSVGQTAVNVTNLPPSGDFTLYSIADFAQNQPSGPAFKVYISNGPNFGPGFSNTPVTLSASGLPAGVTANFGPIVSGPLTGASGVSVLTFTISGSVAAGSYPFAITGTWNSLVHSVNATLSVAAPSFNLTASPLVQTVGSGSSASYTIRISPLSGFAGTVSLAASGLPAGASASFSPPSVTGAGTSTMTVATITSMAAGSYPFSITGTSGTLVSSANATLVVAAGDFSISVTPAFQVVNAGGSVAYTVAISYQNGFAGSVALAASGLPAGATATFDQATLTSSGSATLTINTAATTPIGSNTLVIAGRAGSLGHTVNANLTLNPTGNPWATATIGATPVASQSSYSNGTLTMSALACCVGGTSDAFFGAFQNLTGDGVFTACVSGQGQGGVMIRDSLNPGAPQFSFRGAPLFRQVAGGNSVSGVGSNAGTGNTCYKLARQGATVTAFSTFTQPWGTSVWYQGTAPIPITLASTAAVGVFIAAVQVPSGTLGSATFNNITISQAPEFVLTGPSFPKQSSLNGVGAVYDFQITPILNFTAPVTMSVSGLPAGVTGSFSSPTITGGGSTVLTLTADSTAVQGQYSVTVTATGGGISQTSTFLLVVGGGINMAVSPQPIVTGGAAGGYFLLQVPITITSVSGPIDPSFTFELQGDEGLAQDAGLRSGLAVQTPVSPTFQLTGTGSITTNVPMAIPAGTSAGGLMANIALLIEASGQNIFNLDEEGFHPMLFAPGIALSCFAFPTVPAGGSGSFNCGTGGQGGLADPLTLSIGNLPATVTASAFSPNPVLPNSTGPSSVTLTASTAAPAGSYPITVTSTNGTLSQTVNLQLAVLNFALSANPATQTVAPGGSATYTLTDSPWTFAGTAVRLTVSGLPAHATANFNPAQINTPNDTPATSALTVATATNTPPGTYTLTVTAADSPSGVTRTVNVTLVVSGTFSITTSASTTTITAGSNGTNTVTVTGTGGFSDPVNLTVSGLPSGVTGTFNPTSVNGSGTSTLTLATTAAAPGGSSTVTITGTSSGSSGSQVKTKTFTLTIRSFSLSLSAPTQTVAAGGAAIYPVTMTVAGGFSSTVTFGTSGLPAGATAAFSPATANTTTTTNLTVTTTGALAPGTYPFTITGTSGSLVQSVAATLVQTDGFSLSESPTTVTVTAGSNVTVTVTVAATAALGGSTVLSVSGLPSGAAGTFNPTAVSGSGSSTLTIATTAATPGGNSTVTITGTNGSLTRTATVTLAVKSFTLSASATTLTAHHGGAAVTDTITLTMTGGFNSSTTFSVTGLPAGTTGTFNPTSRTTTGTTTMTVTAGSSTVPGTYSLTVKGTSGTLVESTPVTLTVN